MKMKNNFLIIFIISFCVSCENIKEEDISYSKLPQEVKSKFKNIFDEKIKFITCSTIKNDCNCTTKPSGIPILNPTITIENCDNTYKVDFSKTTINVFLISEKKLYFPSFNGVWSPNIDSTYSTYFKLDTLNFKVLSSH